MKIARDRTVKINWYDQKSSRGQLYFFRDSHSTELYIKLIEVTVWKIAKKFLHP